ncbi:MAG: formyltetrahydrofolate deformylase [Ignavibacteriae bacterium]|nr:MAG: formyltetrahydrofolate deformylase [Ignavibacteriota bacterium]
MKEKSLTATLLLSCPDRRGIVAQIAQFIYERSGNIVDLDEHVDDDDHIFFLRVTWDMKTFTVPPEKLTEVFQPIAADYKAKWFIRLNKNKRRIAIFVSKYAHCLQEILWRHELGEFDAEIALIISNHPDLGYLGERYRVPFHVIPVTAENKKTQELKELELIQREQIDTIILARYMQVLSPTIVQCYEHQILNIHHSFLPAFAGANPYKQAYERGVKIVGATCHYVTEELDEGPIISQDIIRISHKDSLDDLIRKGRDLERLVLARGIRLHLQDRILVDGRKTVVFD